MLRKSFFVKPTSQAWSSIATILQQQYPQGLENVRIVVPTAAHGTLLRSALSKESGIPCSITGLSTMAVFIASQAPDKEIGSVVSETRRLSAMYAELRNHAWLKKLFSAKSNPDMFPLAQTLLTLCNELTETLLPSVVANASNTEDRWSAALSQLPTSVQAMLSDESQLVWLVWKSQLDNSDVHSTRFSQMMRLAKSPQQDLVWISSVNATPMEDAFLSAYSQHSPVLEIGLDWSAQSVNGLIGATWTEILDDLSGANYAHVDTPSNLSLIKANSLEDEAQKGAQTILQWMEEGRSRIAIVAQDRLVARRIRALLERACVFVADETGWKLSTTRAASSLVATLDVAIAKSKPRALLDILKSPFIDVDNPEKIAHVMEIESIIRSGNIKGGWMAIRSALEGSPIAQAMVDKLQSKTAHLSGQKTIQQWIDATSEALTGLGMDDPLVSDPAGAQILTLLAQMKEMFSSAFEHFSLLEWRAFLGTQLESAAFIAPGTDTRVIMLPLNGARLRSFDAVLLVGADANHLPSQVAETMFFANAVRRELGLATRESLQKQQLRDMAEIFLSDAQVVLSYQTHKDGEMVAISPWIERLQLTLMCSDKKEIPLHDVAMESMTLTQTLTQKPMPSAGVLTPATLSPSGYNSFSACPYQFFATRMLGLSSLDDLSDAPEKRNYGNWLHEILNSFHVVTRDNQVDDKAGLLLSLSEQVFSRELEKNPAALGYYARWQKVMPTYLEWSKEREDSGWNFAVGEQKMEKTVKWDGGEITLEGRVDRLDQNQEGEFSVLDYKTSSFVSLSAKIKDTEDHQLPFYGLLPDVKAVAAEFISLEMSDIKKAATPAKNYPKWMAELEGQMIRNVISIKNNEALPANGTESACKYCEAKGVCRKSAWKN
jgi:ATP-dependent helicase/nuclease subunit B